MTNRTLPLLALRNSVLFPHTVMSLGAGRERSLAAVEAALAGNRQVAVFTQRDPGLSEPDEADLHATGTVATIQKAVKAQDGYHLVLHGQERVHLVRLESRDPYLAARVHALPVPEDQSAAVEALHRSVLEMAARLLSALGQAAPEGASAIIQRLSAQMPDPLELVYFIAGTLKLGLEREMQILSSGTRLEALELLYRFLARELEVQEVQKEITSQVKSEMDRDQRQYLLRQQLRAIQQELGEGSSDQADLDLLREKLNQAELPEQARKEADRELKRLERLSPNSPDHSVVRTYLELLAELPWTKTSQDSLDLGRARQILEEDHFGLKPVKERILEHLAVMKLQGGARAPILLLVGPPGVGKTSLGQSVARALDRKFERMSLGGLHDEAELRGHRRTYIGALPGRLIQAVRRAGVKNPVLMLDEVDKLGSSYRGDPASALLEIIDPAQNDTFRDNYLDLPFDLSAALFILTANTTETIPRPLLDRMEVIRLSGYSEEEKLEIARRYLIERQLGQAGLKPEQLELSDQVLRHLIGRYTREAGVRELERVLGRLARKRALAVAEEQNWEPVGVKHLGDLLGPERFLPERAREQGLPGVATGLAWTETGGDVLYVETLCLPTRGLTLTGQLGDVMKESAQAARSYVLSRASRLGIGERRGQGGVHIHVPAGAIPKDGPSAGVTMAVSLASAFSRTPVSPDLAMTGELTLAGLVLPVGGIKEKVLAARRAGIRRVILPRENQKDLRDLPEEVRGEMEFHLVGHLDEVLALALPELGRPLKRTA